MPNDNEIRAAVRGMMKENPVVMGMLSPAERAQLAIAALSEAEQVRNANLEASVNFICDTAFGGP